VFSPFDGSTLDHGWGMAWLTVGLVFGSLAGSLIGRGGYGKIGDGLALFGALAGGLLVEFFSNDIAGLRSGMIVAALSACLMIGIQRVGIRGKTGPTGKAPCRVTAPVTS
jgi:uncharacterized membrane protein YeaQ/YmgE (transglycosylase-associated protein family)